MFRQKYCQELAFQGPHTSNSASLLATLRPRCDLMVNRDMENRHVNMGTVGNQISHEIDYGNKQRSPPVRLHEIANKLKERLPALR